MRRETAGFTLLEIVVATAIVSLFLLGAFGVYRGLSAAVTESLRVAALDEAGRTTLTRLLFDVSSLYAPPATGAASTASGAAERSETRVLEGHDQAARSGFGLADADVRVLTLTTAACLDFTPDRAWPSFCRVEYRLRPDPGREKTHRLVRRQYPFPTLRYRDQERRPYTEVVLADEVAGLSVAYLYGELREEVWPPASDRFAAGKTPDRPEAVEATLTLRDGTGTREQALILRVPPSVLTLPREF